MGARWRRMGATMVTYRLRGVSGAAEGDLRSAAGACGCAATASLLARPAIAVVGTRHPTPYGTGVAEMLSRDLAVRRLLIVSGMARGIDTCAHKGALAARMPTVAVWGTGIDVVYPKENKKLAEEILATGGADCERGAAGDVSGAAEFSAPEPDSERAERGGAGGGGGGELRHAGDGALRGGAEPRPVCGARERDQQELVDALTR